MNIDKNTKISVILPVYNSKEIFKCAVSSVLAQSYPCFEIIIVDDGSTDGTDKEVLTLANSHPCIIPLILKKNGGVSRARNCGIARATGDWVAIIDADDQWHPDRIASMLALATKVEANYVLDNMMLHDIAAGRNHRLMMVPQWDYLLLDQKTYWENCVIGRPVFSILKMMVQRQFIEKTNLAYDEQCRLGEDLIYHGEALALGARAVISSKPTYIYSTRVGAISKSKNTNSKTPMIFDDLADRMELLQKQYSEVMPLSATVALKRCVNGCRTNHRLSKYRAMRNSGKIWGWLGLMLDIQAVRLITRLRYRNYITSKPPYTLV